MHLEMPLETACAASQAEGAIGHGGEGQTMTTHQSAPECAGLLLFPLWVNFISHSVRLIPLNLYSEVAWDRLIPHGINLRPPCRMRRIRYCSGQIVRSVESIYIWKNARLQVSPG